MKRFNWCVLLFFAFSHQALAVTVLCLGDSLTEGFGVNKEEAWPAVTEKVLRDKKKDVSLINAGISGSTSASGPSRMTWQLKSKVKFDWLILALGANDGLRGQDVLEMRKNLEKTIDLAKAGGVKKIFLAEMKTPTSLGKKYSMDFAESFSIVAKAKGVVLLPFFLDGVAVNPKLNLPDGIHPNVEGHRLIAQKIAKFIESKL